MKKKKSDFLRVKINLYHSYNAHSFKDVLYPKDLRLMTIQDRLKYTSYDLGVDTEGVQMSLGAKEIEIVLMEYLCCQHCAGSPTRFSHFILITT